MRLFHWMAGVSIALALLALGIVAFTLLAYRSLAAELPPITGVEEVEWQVPLRIYASGGEFLAEFGEQRRRPVSLEDVPERMRQAFIAAEDHRFDQHRGVDYRSLLRASLHELRTRDQAQGGSTITMQLARNLLLSPEKTYRRKFSEILLAWRIERALDKADILERYLNTVFLGHRAHGVAAAAQVYYGKELAQLDLAQIAMLAGLPQAPSLVNPITDPERALRRRNQVLQRMRAAGFIDAAEEQAARGAPLTARHHGITPAVQGAGHVAEMVRLEMLARHGTRAYTAGFRVHTTIEAHLQDEALRALRAGLRAHAARDPITTGTARAQHEPDPVAEAALVAMNPHTGALRALIGGADFSQSQFNRATQARRQPGSAFKPMVYAVALEAGYAPGTVLNDAPLLGSGNQSGDDWRPRNFGGRLYGPNRLRDALAHSRNLTAVRLLTAVGVESTAAALETWGLEPEQLPRLPSLALGGNNLSPLALTQAYAVVFNGGYRIEPWVIARVEDRHGNRVDDDRPTEPLRVLPEPVAFQIAGMLRDVIVRGTGQAAKTLGRSDLAGKTGTTSGRRDAWFAGYGGDLLTTVWVGFDDNRSLGAGVTGASAALPIWIDFMRAALHGIPETRRETPEGLIPVRMDADDGGRPRAGSRATVTELLTERQRQQWEAWYPPRPQPGPNEYAPTDIF